MYQWLAIASAPDSRVSKKISESRTTSGIVRDSVPFTDDDVDILPVLERVFDAVDYSKDRGTVSILGRLLFAELLCSLVILTEKRGKDLKANVKMMALKLWIYHRYPRTLGGLLQCTRQNSTANDSL